MKTSSEKLENFQAEIVVTIPPEELETHYRKNFDEAMKDIDVPGFRKGKAPANLVKQQIDEDKLWKITLDDVIEDTLGDAMKEQKINAIKTIDIKRDEFKPGGEFTYRAKVALMPEVPEINYRDIPVKVHKREITDKMIDMAIENLRIRIAKSQPIKDRAAIKGDWAAIELEGYEFTRIALPGQSSEPKLLFKTQLGTQLGGERGIAWLDDAIIGMKVGESKTAYLTMPKDFINPPLEEDKEIETRIKLHWLEEKELPELNEENLVSMGIAKDMQELRGHIKVDLEAQARTDEDQEATEKIQSWLVDNMKFDLPKEVIEEKKEEITERLRQEYQKHGEDIDLILKRVDDKANKIRHEIEKLSEEHARLDFIVAHIAEKESLEVNQTELVNHIQMLAQYSQLKKHQVKKLMEDEGFLMDTYSKLLNRKVTNFLLNHSKKEYYAPDHDHEHEHESEEKKIEHKDDKPSGSGLIVTA